MRHVMEVAVYTSGHFIIMKLWNEPLASFKNFMEYNLSSKVLFIIKLLY